MNMKIKEKFKEIYNHPATYFYQASGRCELSGNHTDHQHGIVLACGIDKYINAAVSLNNTSFINIYSEGYQEISIDLNNLDYQKDEEGTSLSLVKGLCHRFESLGNKILGFDAYIISEVLGGSGLSSSAAYEVLIATIINDLFCDNKYSRIELAKFSQYAENEYFGKPSGLMDQTACALGNIVSIDFNDTNNPIVESIELNFEDYNHVLAVINVGASHEDLTADYAAIPNELKLISNHFNKNYLREVNEEDFYKAIPELKNKYGDRPILRAIHIYEENKRVINQIKALKEKDFPTFLILFKESGLSSWRCLQNIIPESNIKDQDMALALALGEKLLKDKGVIRVHGGGFGGSMIAIIQNDYYETFKKEIEYYLGNDSCHKLNINSKGSIRLDDQNY